MSKLFPSFCLLAVFSAASCSTILNNLPGVYTIDIQQGNIIDQSMIDQLRPNMTKRQVLYIMGSPMLKNPFQASRWDYLYSNQPGGEARQQKKITLVFKGENIVGVQGDFRPSSLPVIQPSEETTVDVPKRDLDKTLWEKITGLFDFEDVDEDSAEAEKNPEADGARESILAPDPSR
ncbi:MAG: outer membrane protein assembly factor BamE [Gammaproteobacteria bacterium]